MNKARDDVVEARSGSLEQGLDVGERLRRLLGQILADYLARATLSPGEYGPDGTGTFAELMSAFTDSGLLRVRASPRLLEYTYRSVYSVAPEDSPEIDDPQVGGAFSKSKGLQDRRVRSHMPYTYRYVC